MRNGLYAVLNGTKWAMCRNKRQAIREAKRVNGTARRMDLPNHNLAWDVTTFIMLSEQIYPVESSNVQS